MLYAALDGDNFVDKNVSQLSSGGIKRIDKNVGAKTTKEKEHERMVREAKVYCYYASTGLPG